MGDYDEAHKYYQHINNFENDNEVSLSRAHCYQAMGNYDKALEIIDTIPASERTKPVYIFYARCLADMLNFPSALQAYKQILNWENDRQVLQHLAICKADMGHFDKAITIFHKIPHWQIDKTILISLAHAFVKMGDYNQALATYQQIAYWETDKKALLSIGRCYEKMGEYTKALETYQSIPNWENDKQALLSIAVCNGLMSNPQTNFLFESLTDRFPYFIRGYEDYCRILVENEEIQALGTIEATLKKFPYLQSLYLLKARIHENNRDSKQMFATLMETIQQFPYYPDAYLSLIRYYLIIRNEEAAQRIVDDCYERFPGAQKLFMRIEKLQNMPPRLLMLSYVEDISPLDNRKIPHPEPIRELYSFLKEIPGKHVLCGGVVMQAILQQAKARPIKTSDKDIVSTCTDENALIKKGFWKSKKRPHLYTLKKEGHSIDFTTVPDATNWMDKDVRKRDFTIAALFWDEDETISDPSGLGIPDLLGNVLRMIGNPGIRLKEDATRLLRAAKFMLLGFEPEANLVTALEDWQPTDALNWEHLYALARKHLYHLDRRAYVRALQSYGLLEKLFGIPYHDNVNEALWTLETFLNLDHSFAEEQPSSLISEEADLLSLKQQVQRNPRLADVVVERSELEVKGSRIDGLDLASANPDFHPIGQQPTTEVETPKHPSSVDSQIPINPPASRALSPTMHDHKSSALNAIKTDCKPSLSQATEQKTKPKSTVSGSKQGFFQPAAESLSDFNHPNETDSPESKVPSSKRLSKKRRTALRAHSKASEVMDIPYDCYDSGQAETIPKCTLF
ncbi:tetratricopeptide repeat protein [Legionella sp.]|uniref:tetratricopeptide repeat protein n=1 Tax=Legionella sp. TaxID=459 RepID=UPI00338D8F16